MYLHTRQEPLEPKPRLKHKFKSFLVLQCDACKNQFELKFSTERMNRQSHYCSRSCFNKASKTTVQQHREQTCLKRYGVKNAFASREKQLSIRKTLMKRYGNTNPQQVDEIRTRTSQTCTERYGVPFAVQLAKSAPVSKIETHIIDMLTELYSNIKMQVRINDRWFIDAYVPSNNTYVEIDGRYWHRLDASTENLIETNDFEGLQKRLRDLELNDWFAKHNVKLVRIDERTAHSITPQTLKQLVDNCTGIVATYEYGGDPNVSATAALPSSTGTAP